MKLPTGDPHHLAAPIVLPASHGEGPSTDIQTLCFLTPTGSFLGFLMQPQATCFFHFPPALPAFTLGSTSMAVLWSHLGIFLVILSDTVGLETPRWPLLRSGHMILSIKRRPPHARHALVPH